MSSSPRAKQLLELFETLEPLDEKSRGMPVEAEEWNALIDVLRALLKVNREQDEDLSDELLEGFAPAKHEHLGEVSLAWLDASLQERIAAGGDGVSVRQAVAKIEKSLAALRAEVARLTERSDDQRIQLDRTKIDEITRVNLFEKFDERLKGLSGLRTSVNKIVRSQTALSDSVSDVIKLREQLTDAGGAQIDLSAITTRLDDLEDVRDALTDIDGSPLSLRVLTAEVKQLQGNLPAASGAAAGVITTGDLDTRMSDLEASLLAQLNERETANLETFRVEFTTIGQDLRNAMQARLETGLAEERAAFTLQIQELDAASAARTDALIEEKLATERTGLRGFARDVALGEMSQRLQQISNGMNTRLDNRITGFEETMRSDLTTEMERSIKAGLEASDQRVNTRMEGVEASLAGVQSSLGNRIEEALSDLTPALEARLSESLAGNVEGVRNDLTSLVSESVRDSVTDLMPGLRQVANEAVAEGIGSVDQRIRAAVEASASEVQAKMLSQIDQQIAGVNASVSSQIAVANAKLEENLKTEIATTAASIQIKNNNALEEALSGIGTGTGGGFPGRGGFVLPSPFERRR